MSVEVLVATMNQKDDSLLRRMNISTDVIVGNQCDRNSIETIQYKRKKAIYLNFAERGVGRNRNNTLMRATGDICMLADDDMTYVDNYEKIVEEQFRIHQDADVLIFNLLEKQQNRYVIEKEFKVNWMNYMRFGAARIAFKRKSIYDNGIFFNLTFGGGTEHGHGEDTLFLTDCLKKKLKIYAIPVAIASLTEERDSTWFFGYDEKFLKDKGCLFKCISRRFFRLLCLQDAVRHEKIYGQSWKQSYKIMTKE